VIVRSANELQKLINDILYIAKNWKSKSNSSLITHISGQRIPFFSHYSIVRSSFWNCYILYTVLSNPTW
jgi:hypothetical protein